VNKVKPKYKSYPSVSKKLVNIEKKKSIPKKVGRPKKSSTKYSSLKRKEKKSKTRSITSSAIPKKEQQSSAVVAVDLTEQKKNQVMPLPKSINTLMTKSGIEKYFITSGDKEVRMSIHHGEVKATHNILGWWEQIPTSFLIFMILDEDGTVKRVTIKDKEDSPKNLVVMDNPTTIRICWQEEPTI
jgi:hypothetical protein